MSSVSRCGLALALLGLAGISHPAFAQTTADYSTTVVDPFYVNVDNFTTTTDTSSPTFNRPGLANVPGVTSPPTALSGAGSAVAYATHGFTASQDATYRVKTTIDSGYSTAATSTSGTDNFVQAIYVPNPDNSSGFDPTNPLNNAGLAYSQGASGDSYQVGLAANTNYTLVNTGFYNSNFDGSKLSVGTVTTSIDRLDEGSTTFIPDADALGNTTSASQTLNLTDSGIVSAFNSFSFVGLDHSYLGDLTATLSHDGVSVTLFDQVGLDDSSYGEGSAAAFNGSETYSFTDDGFSLAKAAQGTVDSYGGQPYTDYFPLPGGTFQSLDSLSAFAGTSLSGAWTLTMLDHNNGDVGSFLGFSFNATSNPAPVPEASTLVPLAMGSALLVFMVFQRRRTARAV